METIQSIYSFVSLLAGDVRDVHRGSEAGHGALRGHAPGSQQGAGAPEGSRGAQVVEARVERFGRRGTEPFEPFEPFEFFQSRNFPEFFLRKFKNFRKFQHFLNYRRNSDKISSKSEQKSPIRIQK